MAQKKLKVFIAKQDAHITESLFTNLAETQAVTVMQASLQLETLSQNIRDAQPDVVLFSVHDFSSKVIERIDFVKRTFPKLKTLLLMSIYDERFIIEGLDKDVNGFLLNDGTIDAASLYKNLDDVSHHQQFVLSGKLAKAVMLQILQRNKKEQLRINLANQQFHIQQWELDFLYLLFKKYDDKKIASILQLKGKTIFDYLSHCYRKFNLDERGEIITFLETIMDDPGAASKQAIF